jgi:hypothetical protein
VAAPLIRAKSEEKRKKKARGGIAFTDRQIAVEAAKFRVDVLFQAQPFVPVDCFLVALHRHARRLGATKPLHLFDPIVRVLQMRRRPRRLTGRRPTEVDEHDRSALSGEKGRGRHSGNARTHHADVRVDVLGQTSTAGVEAFPVQRGMAMLAWSLIENSPRAKDPLIHLPAVKEVAASRRLPRNRPGGSCEAMSCPDGEVRGSDAARPDWRPRA